MKKGIVAIGLFVLLVFAVPAIAAEVRTGEQVSIPQNEVINENVYLAGGQVTISGDVSQDAIVGGGRVIVTGSVAGDVLIGGGTIDVYERVGGDVRAVGGQITLGESIAGDVVVIGGSVSVLPGVVIGGDLLVVGGALSIDGTINGDVRVGVGELLLNGVIAGDANVHAGEHVVLGENAVIGGDFTYHSSVGAEIPDSVTIGGEIMFTQTEVSPEKIGAVFEGVGVGLEFLGFLVMMVVMFAMLFVFPRFTRTLTARTVERPWQGAGVGLAAIILIPIISVILLVTLLGAFLGGLVLTAFVMLTMLAKAFLGIVVGAHLSQWFKKESYVSWKWALLGAATVAIVGAIPIIGWIAVVIFFLMTFGALILSVYEYVRAEHA